MQLFLYRDKKEDLIHASINQKKTGCRINLVKEASSYNQAGSEDLDLMTFLDKVTCRKCQDFFTPKLVKEDNKVRAEKMKAEKKRAKSGIIMDDEPMMEQPEPVRPAPPPPPPVSAAPPPAPVPPPPPPEPPKPVAPDLEDSALPSYQEWVPPTKKETPPPATSGIDDSLAKFMVSPTEDLTAAAFAADSNKNPNALADQKPAPTALSAGMEDIMAQFAISPNGTPQPAAPPPAAPVREEIPASASEDIMAQFAIPPVPQPARPVSPPSPVASSPASPDISTVDDILKEFGQKSASEDETMDDLLAKFKESTSKPAPRPEPPAEPSVMDFMNLQVPQLKAPSAPVSNAAPAQSFEDLKKSAAAKASSAVLDDALALDEIAMAPKEEVKEDEEDEYMARVVNTRLEDYDDDDDDDYDDDEYYDDDEEEEYHGSSYAPSDEDDDDDEEAARDSVRQRRTEHVQVVKNTAPESRQQTTDITAADINAAAAALNAAAAALTAATNAAKNNVAVPDLSDIPDVPQLTPPSFGLGDLPDLNTPSFSDVPDLGAPSFSDVPPSFPDVPDLSAPAFPDVPDLSTPAFPDVPDLSAPAFPDVPDLGAPAFPNVPDLNAPPSISDVPNLSGIGAGSLSNPFEEDANTDIPEVPTLSSDDIDPLMPSSAMPGYQPYGYAQTGFPQPVYPQQPSYSQPVYPQPAYPQTGFPQPIYPQAQQGSVYLQPQQGSVYLQPQQPGGYPQPAPPPAVHTPTNAASMNSVQISSMQFQQVQQQAGQPVQPQQPISQGIRVSTIGQKNNNTPEFVRRAIANTAARSGETAFDRQGQKVKTANSINDALNQLGEDTSNYNKPKNEENEPVIQGYEEWTPKKRSVFKKGVNKKF